jgi:hypothetical protein
MRGLSTLLFAAAATLLAGCLVDTLVGSLGCATSIDCGPPSMVCNADGQCVPGCTDDDDCPVGATCNTATGQCTGGPLGRHCASDSDCDPPDVVCRTGDGTCVAGCTLGPCGAGEICRASDGHCCTPGAGDCPLPPDLAGVCNSDPECPRGKICSAGVCVPACDSPGAALCTPPSVCDDVIGRCAPPTCARDTDCDPGSYCNAQNHCAVLGYGGPVACAPSAPSVSPRCAAASSAQNFLSCVSGIGPSGCPYCLGGSCYSPGTCTADGECHAGSQCEDGLCRANSDPCSTLVTIADVYGGMYAAGKQVCVSGKVEQVRTGYDGLTEIKLDLSPYLYVDIPPMYVGNGLNVPSVGQTVTVHGTIRWDASHSDRELCPVDWLQ